jgi:cell division protein ZapA (FtsZ GTPase activity inhibitor)
MLNATNAVIYAINSNSKSSAYDENFHKIDFNVNTSLPNPNIYWLFMDGMLGFNAMEHFFNDAQPEFIAQLTERGFIINREAQFEALQRTIHSISALMSPYYYDTFLSARLRSWDLDDYEQREKQRRSIKMKADFACIKNELLSAFGKTGYQTFAIAQTSYQYFQRTDVKYMYGKKMHCGDVAPDVLANIEKLRCGKILFNHVTVLGRLNILLDSLFAKYENSKLNKTDIQNDNSQTSDVFKSINSESYQGNDRWYFDALVDIMNHSTKPTLTIIHDSKAHWPFIHDEHGNVIKRREKESINLYNYQFQHQFTSSVVIAYIDFILNEDPNSVIILQSDHGLHSDESRQLFVSKYGKNNDDLRLIQNQTISAVRIPDMEIERPIDPLNITRTFVNCYVGANYILLDTEDIIK